MAAVNCGQRAAQSLVMAAEAVNLQSSNPGFSSAWVIRSSPPSSAPAVVRVNVNPVPESAIAFTLHAGVALPMALRCRRRA